MRITLMAALVFLACTDVQAQRARPSRLTNAEVLRIARAEGLHNAHVHGVPLALGTTGSWAALVSSTPTTREEWEYDRPSIASLFIVTRRVREVVLSARLVLPVVPVGAGGQIEGGGAAISILTWRAEDLDGDGALEIEMVLDYAHDVRCGVGVVSHKQLVIVNATPTLTVALSAQLAAYYFGAGGTTYLLRGHSTHEDRNGDGRADVRIRYRDCPDGDADDEDGHACGPARFVDHLYVPASDSFTTASAPQQQPCD
jgi:hypothetical protein